MKNFVLVEGGEFEMGSADGGLDEKPVHLVQLDPFYLCKYELTVSEYVQFLNESGAVYENTSAVHAHIYGNKGNYYVRKGEEKYPAVYVSWDDAQAYIDWLNRRTGLRFRLPSEAEWEYAARGGAKSKGYLYCGANNLDRVAWFIDNSDGSTKPVGKKTANELGLRDMNGNVWEWCGDGYGADYYGIAPRKNPKGVENVSSRVNRGGCWNGNADGMRLSYRLYNEQSDRLFILGFRLARDI